MGMFVNSWPNFNGGLATPPQLKPSNPTLILCGVFRDDYLKTDSHNINETDVETTDLLRHFELCQQTIIIMTIKSDSGCLWPFDDLTHDNCLRYPSYVGIF